MSADIPAFLPSIPLILARSSFMVRAKTAPWPGDGMTSRTALGVLKQHAAALLVAAPAVIRRSRQEKALRHHRHRTGAELYASIGQNGPEGGQRWSADDCVHLFTLTWSKLRTAKDGVACLEICNSNRITYTLPKPKNPLSPRIAETLGYS